MSDAPDPAGHSLRVDDIALKRGERVVVAGVTFTVKPGEIYVLRGPNGAGKTSILRALGGFSPVARGRIDRCEGSTAFLGHADGVKSALTAQENLAFWETLYGASPHAAEGAVATLGVTPFLRQKASTLSSGQRRRLALCRIAISGRKFWLLDEPTAGMDAASSAAVVALVHEHADKSGGAVIATHEPLAFPNARTITLSEAA